MKKLSICFLYLSTIFVIGFAGCRVCNLWREARLIKRARAFFARSDSADALACLRQVLRANPNSLDACQMMAEFAEVGNSPMSIVWLGRALDLDPGSLDNRIALAKAAAAYGDLAMAKKTMDGADDVDKKTARYHQAAGSVDLGLNRCAEAEAHYAEALRLDPANPLPRLLLLTCRLQPGDEHAWSEVSAALQSVGAMSAAHYDAYRLLVLHGLRFGKVNLAYDFSRVVLEDPKSTFADRMLHLGVLAMANHQEEEKYLAVLQNESRNNPVKAYEVARWMMRAGSSIEALAWLRTLPETTRGNLLVKLIEADMYAMEKNWAALMANFTTENWLDLDCLRLACRSVALKQLGYTGSAKTEWRTALRAAGNRRYLLSQLLNMMGEWNCPEEQEDVLWEIATYYPDETLIMESLSDRLFVEGKTSSLMALYKLQVKHDRHDLVAKNNLAMTALLLQSWDLSPHELSRDVYRASPTNVDFVSTYAYSLLLQQKAADSLKVMEKLTPDQLESPGVAAYYGVILKASGNSTKAKKYLDIAKRAKLLPEEQNVVKKARSEI